VLITFFTSKTVVHKPFLWREPNPDLRFC